MKIKTIKVIMSFVLVCIFTLVANGVQALTYEDFEYEYTEDGKGISITGYTNYETRNLVIPDTIENKPVVEIAEYTFQGRDNIKSISFGKNLVRIGGGAFCQCGDLTGTIELPSSIEYVGTDAFAGTNLAKVTLNSKAVYEKTQEGYIYYMNFDEWNPKGLIIDDIVEEKFQNIETLTIPSTIDGQEVVAVYAYFRDTSLKKVIFNNEIIYGVTDDGFVYSEYDNRIYIEDILLDKFIGVQEITIPNTIEGKEVVEVYISIMDTDIKKAYFKGKIYQGVTEQGLYYWQNDDDTITIYSNTPYDNEYERAVDIAIPNTIEGMKVTTIGAYAFSYSYINSIDFGSNLTTIAHDAFYMAEFTFDTLDLPTNITNIESTAFERTKVTVTQGGKNLIAVYDNIKYMFRGNNAIVIGITSEIGDDVVIPSKVNNIPVTEIADNALVTTRMDNWGDNIKTLTIPSSITKLGVYAFGRIFAWGMGSAEPDWDPRLPAYDIHFEGNAPEIDEYTFGLYKGTVTYTGGKTGYDTKLWQEVLGTTGDTETTISEDGTYYVGKDIAPGMYKITGKNNEKANVAAYSTLTDENPRNALIGMYGYIEVKEDDAYISVYNAILTKVDLNNLAVDIESTVEDGTYIVGIDIAPGTYRVQANDEYMAYVSTYLTLDNVNSYNSYNNYINFYSIFYGYIEITEQEKFVNINGGTITKVDLANMPEDIKTEVSEGTYHVGKDVAPGRYKIQANDGYTADVRTYLTLDDANHWENGVYEKSVRGYSTYIEITEQDRFVTVDFGTMTKVDVEKLPTDIKETVRDGMYIVGKDIAPGRYMIQANDGYTADVRTYKTMLDASKSLNNVKWEYTESGYIEITEQDKFVTVNFGTMAKVEEEPKPTISLSAATVNVIEDKTYTGAAITPKPVVKMGSTTLVEGTDYTLAYSNNVNVGTATITITGKGSYIGTKTVTFSIVEKEYEDGTYEEGVYILDTDIQPGIYKIQANDSGFIPSVVTYTTLEDYNSGNNIKEINVNYGYIELTKQDKIVEVMNGKMTKVDIDKLPIDIKKTVSDGIYIIGKDIETGVYKIESETEWLGCSVDTYTNINCTYEGWINNWYYKQGYIELTEQDKVVTVYAGTLIKVDLDSIPTNIKSSVGDYGLFLVGKDIAPGKYKITSTSIEGNNIGGDLRTLSSLNKNDIVEWYNAEIGKIIEIKNTDIALYINGEIIIEKIEEPKPTISLSEATVNTIEDKTYTGSAITPKPVVKVGSTTLVEGTDYTLAYSNNVNVGTATITITGKGNYTGTKVVTFKIVEPEVEDPIDAGYIDFNIDKTVSYDKGTVTVKIIATKPVTDYELVLTLDNITENISVVNKLAGSNAKVKGNKVTMYMIQLTSQADKTVYPAGTVLAEITYKIPEGYFEANKGFDGTATVLNTCAIRITDNGTNYEYSLTKTVTVKDVNVQEILQETLKEITIENNNVQAIKASLEKSTGMTVVMKNIDGVVLDEDSKLGTGTVVEILDASGNVLSSETVSIHGEINGDGEIDFFDAIQMISLVYDTTENYEWNEAVRNAAKFGEEGLPEFFDIINLISYIYG